MFLISFQPYPLFLVEDRGLAQELVMDLELEFQQDKFNRAINQRGLSPIEALRYCDYDYHNYRLQELGVIK